MNQLTTQISVTGMSCQHCVAAAQRALEGVAGVERAEVRLESNSATIVHDETATREAFAAALSEEGFAIG